MSNHRVHSNYDVHQYLKELYQAGIRCYFHQDLPAELKNDGLHHSATVRGILKPTGKINYTKHIQKEYKIPDNIMTITTRRLCSERRC